MQANVSFNDINIYLAFTSVLSALDCHINQYTNILPKKPDDSGNT